MVQNDSFKINYWNPSTPFISSYEQAFDFESKIELTKNYWWISIIVSVIYLALVFYGVYWMKTRPAFDLRKLLVVWSAALAVFSFYGALHVLPEGKNILNNLPD